MESATLGGVRGEWDPEKRVLWISFEKNPLFDPSTVDGWTPTLLSWVGEIHPYGILVDGRTLPPRLPAPFTLRAQEFFRKGKRRVSIAVVGVGRVGQILGRAWSSVSGVAVRFFDDVPEAERWLLESIARKESLLQQARVG